MSNAHTFAEIIAEQQADARDAQFAVTCPDCGAERFSCSACDGEGIVGYEDDYSGRCPIECEKCEGTGLRLDCEECGHWFGA